MESNNKSNRIHPLVAIAAVSVTVLSLTGVAAITGLLPSSNSENGPGARQSPARSRRPQANPATPLTPPMQPPPPPRRKRR